ncbi:MAG: Lipoyl synthase [Alphaproteobacteria bacterium MarineAlpha9_Bin3]|nr:MAG: Lipoyl synthase [Alphaproteobacteria bacterium MarineAlpha9_Bin3]|tara:strand:+ start:43911 stop:44861 length:951 start_codon:yes stop_codon:yes gene_type:complete
MLNNRKLKKNYISNSHLNNSEEFKLKKPSWIRVKAPISSGYLSTKELISKAKLNTVCESASCPNIGECWSKGHATVMILGDVCTRKCGFCNVKSGSPNEIDFFEPYRLAKAISKLNLRHVVITSVDRDDLEDGGANQFVKSIQAIKKLTPNITIEVLTPDFQRKEGALEKIIKAKPDVFNHNLETISRLYKKVRRGASYEHSLNILKNAKDLSSTIFTKSGIMVGLGEKIEEIEILLHDLRLAKVDFVTIGQYMQPTKGHLSVEKYLTIEEFNKIENLAYKMGFLLVSASPLTRSSYHADDDFHKLKMAREKLINV